MVGQTLLSGRPDMSVRPTGIIAVISRQLLRGPPSMTLPGLLAVMVHERPPLTAADLPGMLGIWLQEAGGLAAVGLVVWFIAYAAAPAIAAAEEPWPAWKKMLFIGLAGAAGLAYAVFGILWAAARFAP